MKEQIDNLEGPPPTAEERAAMARELDAVAPTPADKFRLMFGKRPAPRTGEWHGKCHSYHKNSKGRTLMEEAQLIERELGEAREQLETERMRLAAVGVVALADTVESRDRARDMLPEYRSASLSDVERRVDEGIALREQRDRLATALKACREDSCELLGERSWWKDEDRDGFSERYDATAENIIRADEALDSIKGGTSD
jgi:hypothetical protein